MRTLAAALLGVFLAACGGKEEDLLAVRITSLPEDVETLELLDAAPGNTRTFPLEAKSRADRLVTIEARLEGAPKTVQVDIVGDPRLLPRGTSTPRLRFVMPEELGAFTGRVVLTSPELPGWSKSWAVRGEVVQKPVKGRYLRADPVGVALGTLRPEERKEFAVALESYGDEDVAVRQWEPDDPERLALEKPPPDASVVPGGRLQLRGRFRAPKAGGPCEARVRVFTNAQNWRDGTLMVVVTAVVAPDYALRPPVGRIAGDYPVREPPLDVTVEAREDAAPFTVAEVEGLDPWFTLVSKGGEEPARSQTVRLKVKRTAPWDVHEWQRGKVRLRLEPAGEVLDWPVEMLLRPPVYPQPDRLRLEGATMHATIQLVAFGPRRFEVTRARSREDRFFANVQPHREGMQWAIDVLVRPGTPPGIHKDVVVIETDDPDVPALTVPVTAIVPEPR